MRRNERPKYVPWDSVLIGDKVRATGDYLDSVRTNEGVVHHIDVIGNRREFCTNQNVVLFWARIPGGCKAVIEILHRPEPETQTPLFEIGD